MECLRSWSKLFLSEEQAKDVMSSRGDVRLGYLKEFLVRQLKEKGVLKTSSSIETHEDAKKDVTQFVEWNSEMMNKKMGPERATILRAIPRDSPNALQFMKCPYTGSEEDPMRIWIIPIHMVVHCNTDKNAHELKVVGEADEKDAARFAGTGHRQEQQKQNT